jgi:hypothetical protein
VPARMLLLEHRSAVRCVLGLAIAIRVTTLIESLIAGGGRAGNALSCIC